MANNELPVLISGKESPYKILSPAVGLFQIKVKNHMPLVPGSFVGTLRILNSLYDLILPENVSGNVILEKEKDHFIAVGYKDELFSIDRSSSGETININKKKAENDKVEISKGFMIRAFTTGIFYRSPSPDSPPYVEIGSQVEKGKTLGLIEVMKSFNQIVFSGTKDLSKGMIKKIFAQDSQEVKSGDPLFLISKKGES